MRNRLPDAAACAVALDQAQEALDIAREIRDAAQDRNSDEDDTASGVRILARTVEAVEQLVDVVDAILNARLGDAAVHAAARTPWIGGSHLVDGEFQSNKYPTTPRGKVPLSVKDVLAQDLLWAYATRRQEIDAQFSEDLRVALRRAGYRAAIEREPPGRVATPEECLAILAVIKDTALARFIERARELALALHDDDVRCDEEEEALVKALEDLNRELGGVT